MNTAAGNIWDGQIFWQMPYVAKSLRYPEGHLLGPLHLLYFIEAYFEEIFPGP